MNGAIKMTWQDGTTSFIILPIHEWRGATPVFRLAAGRQGGSHLLTAADIRGSWNAWVRDLVRDSQMSDSTPVGVEVY